MRLLSVCFLFLLLLGPPVRAEETSPPKVPRLTHAPEMSFGTVYSGEIVDLSYELGNSGTADLVIRDVRPSCGCTVVAGFDGLVKPGKKTALAVKIDTKGFDGPFDKTISLVTNDPARTNVVLRLVGTLRPLVTVIPPSGASFGQMAPGSEATLKIRFVSRVERPLKLTLVEGAAGPFRGTLSTVGPGKEYELVVSTTAGSKPGAFHSTLNLHTDFPGVAAIPVKCSAVVPQRIEARPPAVVLPRELPRSFERTVLVVNSGEKPLRVLGAGCDDDRVEVKVLGRPGEATQRIRLSFPAGFGTPKGGATLTVQTDDPEYSHLVIPVRTVGDSPAVARFDETFGLPVRVEPPSLLLDAGFSGDLVTGQATLINLSDAPLELAVLDKGSERFAVVIDERIPGKKFLITVDVKGPIPLGSSEAMVRLSTNLEAMPVVTIPCSIYRESHLFVRPQAIALTGDGKGRTIRIEVEDRRSRPVRILSARCDEASLSVSIEKRKDAEGATVVLDVPAGYELPNHAVAVLIRTDDPEHPEIEVPVSGQKERRGKRGKRFGGVTPPKHD